MRELSIEQRAEAYNKALEMARIAHKDEDRHLKATLERVFPELKENEDERIRKALIRAFKSLNTVKVWNGIERTDILAWLEKQGEQKYIPKYKIGDYVKNTNYKGEPIYEIVYMDKECYICEYRGKERMGDKAVIHFSFDNPYLRLVQKPADKVEPKFHIGDIVKRKDNPHLTYILKRLTDDGDYEFHAIRKDGNEGCTCFATVKYQDDWELVEQKPADKVKPKFHKGEWVTIKE